MYSSGFNWLSLNTQLWEAQSKLLGDLKRRDENPKVKSIFSIFAQASFSNRAL